MAPYSFTWKDVQEGTYSITAVATDNLNLKTTSSPVSVVVEKSASTVNQLPVVSIDSPSKGRKIKKNDKIILEATTSDPDGSISRVEFKSGNITIAELTTAPYIYTWENVDTGSYIITAIATDNLGASNTSSEIEFFVEDFYDPFSEFINLYPNPNNGNFKIDLYSGLSDQVNNIIIIGSSGQTVYKDAIKQEEYTREIDISNYPSGAYVLMVTNSYSIVSTKKFIKR